MEKVFEPIPKFVPDDHKGCKGHANHMLDCTYEKVEDRNLMISILDARIKQNEKDQRKSEREAKV